MEGGGPMIDLAWLQISGAVAGGVVGVFSSFVANLFYSVKN
jgi:hypothetical protein